MALSGFQRDGRRVVFLRSSPPFKEPRLLASALFLHQWGFEPQVFFWDRQWEYEERLTLFSIEFIPGRTRQPAPYEQGVRSLRLRREWLGVLNRWLREVQPHAVHTCDMDMALSYWLTNSRWRRRAVRWVYDIFDFLWRYHTVPRWLRTLLRSVDRVLYTSADVILLPEESRLQAIPERLRKKVRIAPNAPVLAYFYERGQLPISQEVRIPQPIGEFVLFYPGVLSESRHVRWLLRIVRDLPEVEVWIAGWGPLRTQVEQDAARHPRIRYLGQLTIDAVLPLYREVDLLFAMYDPRYPVNRQASPSKIFEALWFGIPVLATRGMGLEPLQKHLPGLHLLHNSYADFVEGVRQTLARYDQWREAARTARQYLLARIQAFARALAHAYAVPPEVAELR